MTGAAPVAITKPCNVTGDPRDTFWSGPAEALGAPGERGPSLAFVAWTTSKLVMPTDEIWLKAFAGQRSSGVIEMEKKLPLSATIAPYFFSPSKMAFSSLLQV